MRISQGNSKGFAVYKDKLFLGDIVRMGKAHKRQAFLIIREEFDGTDVPIKDRISA